MSSEEFSLKHNPEKNDPQYYQTLLKHFQLTPDDVVYFEHAPEAVESARSVGITTYHYDHTKRDMKALQAFLDDNL